MALRIMGKTVEQLGALWLRFSHLGEALGVKEDTTHSCEFDLWELVEYAIELPLVYPPIDASEVAVYCDERTQRLVAVGRIPGVGLWSVELTTVLAQGKPGSLPPSNEEAMEELMHSLKFASDLLGGREAV